MPGVETPAVKYTNNQGYSYTHTDFTYINNDRNEKSLQVISKDNALWQVYTFKVQIPLTHWLLNLNKLARVLSRVSVGNNQASRWGRWEGIELDKFYIWSLSNLNALTAFHKSPVTMFIVLL